MGYKDEALELYSELNQRAHHEIKCGEDLLRIIETAYQFELREELEQLAFSGKYSYGLLSIIQKGGANLEEDYFEKLKAEYTESIKTVKNDIDKILKRAADFYQNIFREKYFTLSHDAMFNLSNFCSDLNHLKLLLNDKKRMKTED